MVDEISEKIGEVYRNESRRVFATLIRVLGDFDLAEEALHDAFAAAIAQWPREGFPENPRAWLVSAGRFKAIDSLRRRARFNASLVQLAENVESRSRDAAAKLEECVEDDRLRLIFTCCHPALAPESQIALTLREVCGLTTEAIASAFLTTPSTLAQRIVRAKSKIREAGIPFEVPAIEEVHDRIDSVLQVIYLVFNEGYAASSGASLTQVELSDEAIRLGRLLAALLPDNEVLGLLALMLLHESRREARTSASGEIVLLEDQDRTRWDHQKIEEGRSLVRQTSSTATVGPYALQAAIVAVHSEAASAAATDWNQIVTLYDLLLNAMPSPIVELNRAVAVAMHDGPENGLAIIDSILATGQLTNYHLAHAARADMLRRLDRLQDARAAYEQSLALARQEPEKRFLEARLAAIR